MRGAVILNGISRKKKFFYTAIYPRLSQHFKVTVLETKSAGDARALASQCSSADFDFVLAAGGDGTLNQVLNGMLETGTAKLPLGLIPLGTGNDFARTCGLIANADSVIRRLTAGAVPTDMGHLICRDSRGAMNSRYFLNCASIGIGPDVVKRLENNSRVFGAALTYLFSIAGAFLAQKLPSVTCEEGSWKWSGKVRVLATANGRTFGDAVSIAPDADPGDGVLNLFIAGDFSVPQFLVYLLTLKSGKKIVHPRVIYRPVSRIAISGDAACAIETEGELAGFLPAEISVHHAKILFFR